MSSSYYPTSMNVGVMDILNFLDKKDAEQASYDMMKENDNSVHGYQDSRHNLDDLERRESRIPVAVRRLRPRSDRPSTILGNENGPSRSNDAKVEDWQSSWNNSLEKQQEEQKCKLPRLDRRKPPLMVGQMGLPGNGQLRTINTNNLVTTNGQHLLCPKCGRSCIMINKDGVYVAFTMGVTPLVLFCLFLMCLFLGWLGLGYGVGPAMLRRLRLPYTERERSKNNWMGKWFSSKENH